MSYRAILVNDSSGPCVPSFAWNFAGPLPVDPASIAVTATDVITGDGIAGVTSFAPMSNRVVFTPNAPFRRRGVYQLDVWCVGRDGTATELGAVQFVPSGCNG